jgi:hypothetical protein
MKIKKEVYEGQMIPKFYGLAYCEFDRFVAVTYPIPLNLIIGYFRKIWLKMKCSKELLKDVRVNAYRIGYEEGKESGKVEATKEVLRQSKDYFIALNEEISRVFPKVRKPLSKLKNIFY